MDPSAGMDHHSRWLVDGDQVVILVERSQRNVFRRGAQRSGLGRFDIDALARAHLPRGAPGCPVYQDAAVADPFLDARTAVLGQLLVYQEVEALPGIFRPGGQLHGRDRRRPLTAAMPRPIRAPGPDRTSGPRR